MFRFLSADPHTASAIFNLLYQSTIIFLSGWILLKIFKRSSAPFRSALSMTALAAVLLLPFGILFFKSNDSVLQSLSLPSIQQTYNHYLLNKESPEVQQPASQETREQPSALQVQETGDRNSKGMPGFLEPNPTIKILNLLGLFWLCGSVFLLVRLSYSLMRYRIHKKTLEPAENKSLRASLDGMRKIYPQRPFPQVLTSDWIVSPCSQGIRNPKIIIPRQLLADADTDELETILFHELYHIHHKDHLFSLLPVVVRIIFWWNPLANSVIKHHSSSREFICDNEVIRAKGAYSYAQTLFTLARKTHLVSRIPFSMGMADDRSPLEFRIQTIISKERSMTVHLKKPVKIFLVAFTLIVSMVLTRQSWTFSPVQSPQKIVPLPDLIQPYTMAVEKDRLFIRDEGSISIYALSDFSLIKKFGRQGQGPGEFHDSPFLIIATDEIFIGERTKNIRFSLNGDFLAETKLPYSYIGFYPLMPVGDNFVGFPMSRIDNSGLGQIGNIYSSEFEKIREFYGNIPFRIPPPPLPPRPGSKTAPAVIKEDFDVIRDYVSYEVSEDKIFVADTRKGFFIAVFDSQGQPLYEIDLPYKETKVPKQFEDAFYDRIRQSDHAEELFRRNNYLFRKVFPALVDFQINDGKIYVTSSIHKENLYEIIVLDLKGGILKRSFSLPSKLYLRALHNNQMGTKVFAIHDNKIYSLDYNDEEDIYELHIHSLK